MRTYLRSSEPPNGISESTISKRFNFIRNDSCFRDRDKRRNLNRDKRNGF